MPKPSDLLARVEERQISLEKSFVIHQDYTKEMFESLSADLKSVIKLQTIANGRTSNLEKAVEDHNKRLPLLEHWKTKIKGMGVTVLLIAGVLNALILIWLAVVT